ncbi:Elongation factor Tu GTP-binding domain-containing protein 1 [Chondrus crispus]|uniref:Elongation factor-like 1 n=1 Tax=Chondrus crispus TaxID=2769 RepID=R7QIA2_CHOCR|nr:Elongation factor Tu GTP-binding domain-containing protein 1 [Chondrus crispus]CDF37145.1 Elongation factor Tu GTP-binding domain-containing protein 1 [Chondrus crispus]|eukprot:XP_005716964.1 Elongation factor Tu GTP-binding domain-containing protein 1 [Chondrus crispus]
MTSESPADLKVPASRTWNICMLAHVDHGKSALSDSLISANGIISSRSAGKVRYMDSREDEQRRGITMKSSSIALGHKVAGMWNPGSVFFFISHEGLNVVNLVDSPGHVDFSGEVEAALRICDGAVLVVDVVEGVCVQTVAVLRAALEHAVRPVLVLNKIDRLFTELHLEPMEAYEHIVNILGQANVIMGVREVEQMMAAASVADVEDEGDSEWKLDEGAVEGNVHNVSGFFSPELGNVVFASAIDGWAFRIADFARIFSHKFGISERVLTKTLWGDYYFQPKAKRISRKKSTALKSRAKPMFVQFILSNVHAIYETIHKTQHDLPLAVEKREMFVSKLGLKVSARDLKHRDAQTALHAIMNAWLPAASCLMDTVIEKLPSAADAQADNRRLAALWPNGARLGCEARKSGTMSDSTMLESFERQQRSIATADAGKNAPVIALVSKMVEGKDDQNPLSNHMNIRTPMSRSELQAMRDATSKEKETSKAPETLTSFPPMVAMARILSGTLTVGDSVFVYSPKYQVGKDGSFDSNYVSEATVTGLFLLMGRGMEPLNSASAGSVVGIAGMEDAVLKTATISSEKPGECLPVGTFNSSSLGLEKDAVVRVAVEPHLPQDVGKLRDGLRRLNQADPAVETFVTTKGEHVVAANGELHLETCLKDLRERYAKGIRIHVSKPIVSFRETVLGGNSQNDNIGYRMTSIPLPEQLAKVLERASSLLRQEVETIDDSDIRKIREDIEEAIDAHAEQSASKKTPQATVKRYWIQEILPRVWSCGPRQFGSNLLLGPYKSTTRSGLLDKIFGELAESKGRATWNGKELEKAIVAGFQLGSRAGPLCEEPMHGVGFVLDSIRIPQSTDIANTVANESSHALAKVSGLVIGSMREGVRLALMQGSPRLMEGVLHVDISVPADALGRTYTVLGQRRGRVLKEEVKEGINVFGIEALLPVQDSFGFTDLLRKQTSGFAVPQMVFSHWEIIDTDPFWTPQTDEELEDLGAADMTAENNNLARKLINGVRRRKGLKVEEKIVENAEKQRTLSRKK